MKASWVFLLKKQQELEIPAKPTIEKLKKMEIAPNFWV